MTWRPEDSEVAHDPLGRPTYYGRDGEPISLREWAENRQTLEQRRVDYTMIRETYVSERGVLVDAITVSTVYLGIDHSFGMGPPLIFETMVFGGELDDEVCRYTTEEQARKGHEEMVQRVREAEDATE